MGRIEFAINRTAAVQRRPSRGLRWPTVFLIGAPRSGTTWLQNLLGAHPSIATCQELNVFGSYVARLHRLWTKQLPPTVPEWREQRFGGLPSVLTEDEFVGLVMQFISGIYERLMALKPSASIVLDKHPEYGFHVDLIQHYVPHARFIHLIRDGRDVAASMVRSATGWGRRWAPRDVKRAGHIWRAYVDKARQVQSLAERFLEIRYEKLLAEPAPTLQQAFEFCGVQASANESAEICARHSLEAMRDRQQSSLVWGGEVLLRLGHNPEEPAGFYGAGSSGSWKRIWRDFDRWTFDRCAGSLLMALGYETDPVWHGVGRGRQLLFSAREAVGDRADRMQRLLERVKRRVTEAR